MSSMFDGVKVLEVAEWTFVPAAAAILAEFGADVVKVERPKGGDIQRGLAVAGVSPVWNGVSLQMEASNRGGKRSVGIDLTRPEGRELVLKLAAQADVFVTSLLPKARRKLGVDVEDVRAVNPNIVYAYGHGMGSQGPDSDKGGYDVTVYWCRSGLGYALSDPEFPEPVRMRPAMGDRIGAMNLVAGVASALFKRERTGEGTVVEVSLLGTAMWQLASDVVYSNALGIENSRVSRGRNPLSGYYRTSDDRWLALALLESDRWWRPFAAVAGLEHLVDDPRFLDHAAREASYEECGAIIAEAFRGAPLEEWRRRLAGFGGPWEPIQSMQEVAHDPQVVANQYLAEIETHNGQRIKIVPAPIRFDGELGRLDPCPEVGASTEEILLEAGESWDDIIRHKEGGYIT